ncbi:hypothetical protein EV646_109387 [Kribbella antiqua]|uniref:Uncharacterized protein n=1 Tax=Kribbella antiqua TaxID=2512217 RepID=A0A4R2IL76_9ACTN|nr:hypothetical protein [Kribbella antiqua]TCO45212.1 hypothetical protein EV646_109387 [Kribbella antiqua]
MSGPFTSPQGDASTVGIPDSEPNLGTQFGQAMLAAATMANRARKGESPDPSDEERLRSAVEPIVAAGFAAAIKLAKRHKPTPEQRRAARDSALRMAQSAKERASALLRTTE